MTSEGFRAVQMALITCAPQPPRDRQFPDDP
jgi:hypothetical protein